MRMKKNRARGVTSIVFLAALIACDEPHVVPSDQIRYHLVAVDDKPLPAEIGSGVSTRIRLGELLGSPGDDRCEYHVQIERSNSLSNIEGPVYNCAVKKGGELLIRIDVGELVGSHEFLFRN